MVLTNQSTSGLFAYCFYNLILETVQWHYQQDCLWQMHLFVAEYILCVLLTFYLNKFLQVLYRKAGFFYYIVERSFLQLFMIWNYHGDIFIKIMQKDMASPLMVNHKTTPSKCLDDLSSGECLAHTTTSTSFTVTPGFSFISFNFSNPSR